MNPIVEDFLAQQAREKAVRVRTGLPGALWRMLQPVVGRNPVKTGIETLPHGNPKLWRKLHNGCEIGQEKLIRPTLDSAAQQEGANEL